MAKKSGNKSGFGDKSGCDKSEDALYIVRFKKVGKTTIIIVNFEDKVIAIIEFLILRSYQFENYCHLIRNFELFGQSRGDSVVKEYDPFRSKNST